MNSSRGRGGDIGRRKGEERGGARRGVKFKYEELVLE